MPACRHRWIMLLLLPALVAAAASRAGANDEDAPPTDTPSAAQDPAEPDVPADIPELKDTWATSRDPAGRYWNVTSYLKGTPAEVRTILDMQVLEFDGKAANVLAEIAQNEREAQSLTDEALAAARAAPNYKSIQTQADAAKAELDAARAGGGPIDHRMAASQKYNRFKADLDKLERQALAKTSTASLKAAREKLLARADTFYARRAEAFAWRRKLVNAIVLGQTMKGRLIPGESIGLLDGAKVERVNDDRTVLARFPLLQTHEVIGEKEGVKQIEGHVEVVQLLIRGLDDVQRMRPKQELTLHQVFKVVDVREIEGRAVYVVDPYPCDFNYLLNTIVKPPKMKAPPRGLPPTTSPSAAKGRESPPADEPSKTGK